MYNKGSFLALTMTLARDKIAQDSVQLLPQPVTFDEFIDWYPENSPVRYELRGGAIIEMPKPRGIHSEVAGAVAKKLNYAIDLGRFSYFIPKECIVKCGDRSGYEPDGIILDRSALADEPLWATSSAIEHGSSIKIIIEVVSGNWQDDYELKMAEYESLGIPEYWIVDYAGLGGIRHLGKPKQPTLTICTLVLGEYEIQRFRGDELVISGTFPDLNLTAMQVLSAE
jgi:Uma2 family endonuclease